MELCNKYSPNQHRRDRNKISHFNDAGWSFSSFGGPSKIREKFESIAHKEFNKEKFKDMNHIIKCQKTGADLFHRNVKSQRVKENFFPKDLLDLMKQNSKFYFGSES